MQSKSEQINPQAPPSKKGEAKKDNLEQVNWPQKTNAYWKKHLTPLQYKVCREAGTETPRSGFYDKHKKRKGIYHCSSCGYPLFNARYQYDSKTGWPSFTQALDGAVKYKDDYKLFIKRTEVLCTRCGAHLGHVFDDGPPPTGKRYCMNSVCLRHETDL